MNKKAFHTKIPSDKRKWLHLLAIIAITIASLLTIYGILSLAYPEGIPFFSRNSPASSDGLSGYNTTKQSLEDIATPDWISKDYLTPNEYSRPQTPLSQINGVVVHYVGNPNTTAAGNRNYFEQLAVTEDTYASSHFIIGLDGEIIQCVPLNEIAYCSNERNSDTISIECCHPDAQGQFNDQTYDSLLKLVDWLCDTYDLNPQTDVIRHYDVTGKECPKYYVDHPDAWTDFLQDLSAFR